MSRMLLDNNHGGVAGFAFASFVDGYDAVLEFFGALLIDECRLGDYGYADVMPVRL